MKYKQVPFNLTVARLIIRRSVDGFVFVNKKSDDSIVGIVNSIATLGNNHIIDVYSFDASSIDNMGSFVGNYVVDDTGEFTLCGNKVYLTIKIPINTHIKVQDGKFQDDKFDVFNIDWTPDTTLSIFNELIRHGVWNRRRFESICCELAALHNHKNADYGDSFSKTMDKFGMSALCVRLHDKLNRLISITEKGKQEVKDESIEDTLMDLASYAIMGIEYLWNHR